VGGVAVFLFCQRPWKSKGLKEQGKAPFDATRGKESLVEKQAREKEENKRKILEFFESKLKVVNDDIEALLGVSDATTTRYLEELEREGLVRQVGKTGKHVYYEKAGGSTALTKKQ